MNFLTLQIAFRYLISKKSTNAINLLTIIAMGVMACGSAALIILLSVFNGFEGLVKSLYQSFNPDIRITAKQGKVFEPDEETLVRLEDLDAVEDLSSVLEENAILKYDDNEYIATIKGVDNHYEDVTGVRDKVIFGDYELEEKGVPYAVMGIGVAGALDVNLDNPLQKVSVYLPRRGRETMSLNPSQAFIRKDIIPAGVFSIQQEFDSKFVFAPLDFVKQLLKYDKEVSALELKLRPEADVRQVQQEITAIMGPDFYVNDRFQQNEFLYKIMKNEKWAVYAILSLILIIAAFNIIGALSMMVIEKTKDIVILKTMGATKQMIRRVFLMVGLLTSLIGSFSGIVLAVFICLIQIQFGIVKLQGQGTFIIDAYPVELRWPDFIGVLLIVVVISVGTSWMPAHRAASQEILINQE